MSRRDASSSRRAEQEHRAVLWWCSRAVRVLCRSERVKISETVCILSSR